jgi:hypothetical protein
MLDLFCVHCSRAVMCRICEANSNLPAVIHRSTNLAFAKFGCIVECELDPRHAQNGNHCTFYGLSLPENIRIFRAVH